MFTRISCISDKTQHILKQMNASISIQMLEIIQYYFLHAFNTLLFRACSNSFWARIVIIRKAEHSGNPSLFVCLHILLKHNYTTQPRPTGIHCAGLQRHASYFRPTMTGILLNHINISFTMRNYAISNSLYGMQLLVPVQTWKTPQVSSG